MSHRLQTARQYPKDNLYRRLGTRSNISQARIREKYVARLREFPPETHPEEFRIIREAYEILSNPETRADYDAARQGKQSWEELFEAGAKAFAGTSTIKLRNFWAKLQRLGKTALPT